MSAVKTAYVDEGCHAPVLLYIEDDIPTAEIFRGFLQDGFLQGKAKQEIRLVVAADVDSAMAAVEGSGAYATMSRPGAIVLDLHLPCVNGFAILEQIRATPGLQNVPVVIFSSSISPSDRRQAEILGASEFITKPMGFDEFGTAVDHICSLLVPA